MASFFSLSSIKEVLFQSNLLDRDADTEVIFQFCVKNQIPYRFVSKDYLKDIIYDKETVVIADFGTTNRIVRDMVDTYDVTFYGLYGNEKNKSIVSEIATFPVFVKPIATKIFDGQVFHSKQSLLDFVNPDTEVYSSEVMRIVDETRILITNTNEILGYVPQEFKKLLLDRLIEVQNNRFWVIDIASHEDTGDDLIVEVNHTYSFGYGNNCDTTFITADYYCHFVFSAWQNLRI